MIVLGKNKLIVSLCTDTGNTRKINQDNFYSDGKYNTEPSRKSLSLSAESDGGLFAVADGMGGEANGEKASLFAVEALNEIKAKFPSADDINSAVSRANERVCEMITATGSRSGTTIAAAVIKGKQLNVYNIGDSKCLLYHDGKLDQLSKDHTVTAQMIEAGLITKEEAAADRRRHQLFQHIGISPEEMKISVSQSEGNKLNDGDIVILCSDGMTDGLDDNDIVSIIKSNSDKTVLAQELVSAALTNGSKDNTTALTVFNHKKKHSGLKLFLLSLLTVGAAAFCTLGAMIIAGIIKLW